MQIKNIPIKSEKNMKKQQQQKTNKKFANEKKVYD